MAIWVKQKRSQGPVIFQLKIQDVNIDFTQSQFLWLGKINYQVNLHNGSKKNTALLIFYFLELEALNSK